MATVQASNEKTRTVLGRLEGVKRSGGGWQARCPAHDDHNPSLSVKEGNDGVLLTCHAGCSFESIVGSLGLEPADLFFVDRVARSGRWEDRIQETYDYVDEYGKTLFQAVRLRDPKDFRQRRPNGRGGWDWKLNGVRRVLLRLPQVVEAVALDKDIYVCEGERDVHALESLGAVATTNPMGAGKWRPEYSEALRGARVHIIADRDEPGMDHARQVADALNGIAESVEILQAREGKDPHDHVAAGFGLDDFDPVGAGPETGTIVPPVQRVSVGDFYAYLPEHKYLFVPTRDLWPAASVDSRLDTQRDPRSGAMVKASRWLDQQRSVEQMTWAPGFPMIIENLVIADGGWVPRPGIRAFNTYRPAPEITGNSDQAVPWLEHVHRIYPEEAPHLIDVMAHRVQRPHEKVNHALVFGGGQGIGKDTTLEPWKRAVGSWNWKEIVPANLLGRFNDFVESVVLRVNEGHDLGDLDRYALYERLKLYTASPPDVLRVDKKYVPEYAILNVCSVVITTNYKTNGLYIPAEDRRHFVAWSEATKEEFSPEYWDRLWRWYENGGYGHVAAYLAELDLTAFNPKAPPPKTRAFWDVVDANRAPEDAELAEALDKLQAPPAVTIEEIKNVASSSFREWLEERRNRRQIPHRFESAGYVVVRNDASTQGLWSVNGRKQAIYGRRDLSVRDRLDAVNRLVEALR